MNDLVDVIDRRCSEIANQVINESREHVGLWQSRYGELVKKVIENKEMLANLPNPTELWACLECGAVFCVPRSRCPVCEHGPENSQPGMVKL